MLTEFVEGSRRDLRAATSPKTAIAACKVTDSGGGLLGSRGRAMTRRLPSVVSAKGVSPVDCRESQIGRIRDEGGEEVGARL